MKSNYQKYKIDSITTTLSVTNCLWRRRKNLPIDCLRNGNAFKENYHICAGEDAVSGLGILFKKSRKDIMTNLGV